MRDRANWAGGLEARYSGATPAVCFIRSLISMLQAQQLIQNRYLLKHKLGQNIGRQTWLAEDTSAEPAELVIVKLLGFVDHVDWDTLKLFEREAKILRQLNHPQIPKYRDYFAIDDRTLWFALVQEYIPGISLKDWLAKGKRLSEARVRRLATEVLNILIYLHELSPPVLHRDIKPSNLILGDDRRIHLIDFGAVQDRAAISGATFTVVGTYGYTPMEQFGGRTVPASDLYSLGATLIHLLTGVSPADLPQKALRLQFTDLVSLNPSLIHWIETLVEPDLAQRCKTARTALAALRSGQSLRAQRSLPPMPQPEHSRIILEKSPEELLIRCPEGSSSNQLTVGAWMLLFFVLVALILLHSVFPNFVFPNFVVFVFFLNSLTIAGRIVINALRQTVTIVHLDRECFAMYEKKTLLPKWLAPDLELGTVPTACIENVIQHNLIFGEGELESRARVVTIQTDSEDYYFGKGLSKEECIWLVQEIKDWLEWR
jgi:serine/threonine protein kinase